MWMRRTIAAALIAIFFKATLCLRKLILLLLPVIKPHCMSLLSSWPSFGELNIYMYIQRINLQS